MSFLSPSLLGHTSRLIKSNADSEILCNREREMFARGIRFRSVIKLKESANV